MENIEVTILRKVIYQNKTLEPGEIGKLVNISVPKDKADNWIQRGLAKLRNPEDEITREEALQRTQEQAAQLNEAGNVLTAAQREKIKAEKARNIAQGHLKTARTMIKNLTADLARAGKKIAGLEAELAEARKPVEDKKQAKA